MDSNQVRRKPHYLRGSKRTTLPGQLIVVDTETLPTAQDAAGNVNKHRLRLGHAFFCRLRAGKPEREQECMFTSADAFWYFVDSKLSPRRSTWLMSHSLGFDLSILGFWGQLESGRYDVEQWNTMPDDSGIQDSRPEPTWRGLVVLEDPPNIIVVRHGKSELACVDSVNYWRVSVEQLGREMGLPKLVTPTDSAPDLDWRPYCRRDAEIVYRQVLSLFATWYREQWGKIRYTAAGCAMEAFKTRYLSDKVLVHCNGPVTELERAAYYPGELVAYRRGIIPGPIYHLDVSSLFPSVMEQNKFPVKLHKYYSSMSVDGLGLELDDYDAVARVRVVCPPPGYMTRHNGIAVRAHGDFVTHLCGPELMEALVKRHVKWVGLCATYQTADIFSRWVSAMWSKRLTARTVGMSASADMYKLLLTSLTGKFAQKSPHWVDLQGVPAPSAYGNFPLYESDLKRITRCRALNYAVQAESVPGESPDAAPAISAWITAYARERMRGLIEIAGPDDVYYMDTDSLICSQDAYTRLCVAGEVVGGTLGKLRLLHCGDDASIVGPKHYRVGTTWTIAGVKRSAKQCPDGGYEQDQFERLETVLNRTLDGSVIVQRVVVHPGTVDLCARYDQDGRLIPLRLPVQDDVQAP